MGRFPPQQKSGMDVAGQIATKAAVVSECRSRCTAWGSEPNIFSLGCRPAGLLAVFRRRR
jgi:hypothetical protein